LAWGVLAESPLRLVLHVHVLGIKSNARINGIAYFGLLGNHSGKGVPGDLEMCGVEKESSYLDVLSANHVAHKNLLVGVTVSERISVI
jgi:hypothetical protein